MIGDIDMKDMAGSPMDDQRVITVNLLTVALIGPIQRRERSLRCDDPRVQPTVPQLLENKDSLLGIGLVMEHDLEGIVKPKGGRNPKWSSTYEQRFFQRWLVEALAKGVEILHNDILSKLNPTSDGKVPVRWCPHTPLWPRETAICGSLGGAATLQSDSFAHGRGGLTTLLVVSVTVPAAFANFKRKLSSAPWASVGMLKGNAGPGSSLWNVRVETTPSWDLCKDYLPRKSLRKACQKVFERLGSIGEEFGMQIEISNGNKTVAPRLPVTPASNVILDEALHALTLDPVEQREEDPTPEKEVEKPISTPPPGRVPSAQDVRIAVRNQRSAIDMHIHKLWQQDYFEGAEKYISRQVHAVRADYHAQEPWYGTPPGSLAAIDKTFWQFARQQDRQARSPSDTECDRASAASPATTQPINQPIKRQADPLEGDDNVESGKTSVASEAADTDSESECPQTLEDRVLAMAAELESAAARRMTAGDPDNPDTGGQNEAIKTKMTGAEEMVAKSSSEKYYSIMMLVSKVDEDVREVFIQSHVSKVDGKALQQVWDPDNPALKIVNTWKDPHRPAGGKTNCSFDLRPVSQELLDALAVISAAQPPGEREIDPAELGLEEDVSDEEDPDDALPPPWVPAYFIWKHVPPHPALERMAYESIKNPDQDTSGRTSPDEETGSGASTPKAQGEEDAKVIRL